MKKQNKITWIIIVMLTFSLLAGCSAEDDFVNEPISDDEISYQEENYLETPEDCLDGEEYDPVEQLCYDPYEDGDSDLLIQFFDLVDSALAEDSTAGDDYQADSEQRILTYEVQGNQLKNPQAEAIPSELQGYQDDRAVHEKIWVYFAGLIPQEQRRDLVAFVVFTDGPDETLAAVEQTPEDPQKWLLAVDVADAADMTDLTYTLVHEFGHLLTLNQRQVPPAEELFLNPDNEDLYAQAVDSCPDYFPGEGCALPKSYLNQFYDRFWGDLYNEWLEIDAIEDEDAYYQALDEFYQQYSDQFVSDYAATNPEEDIAESFTYFILKPKPAGDTIAEQKVLFFYQFQELMQLRNQMIERTYSRLRRAP